MAICAITLAAALLRLVGVGDGLPYINNPDEPAVADRALHILQTGDFNPHYFVYPNLYTYMQAAVFVPRFLSLVSSAKIERLDQIVPTDFYLWGRLLTAALGTLTVPLVYMAGRRLYGTAVGLIAAAFIATNSLHMQHSQFIATDVPATFFSALALLAIAHLLPVYMSSYGATYTGGAIYTASRRAYLVAGVAMGLAVGTKYNSALVILAFLLAHGFEAGLRAPGGVVRFFGARLWIALGGLVATFLLTTPFALLDLPHFLNDVASVIAHYNFGHQGFESDYNWRVYVPEFLRTDFGATALTLAGTALAFVRHRHADLVLAAFPVAYYFTMSSYRVNFPRNILPMLPFTSVLAALALVVAWQLLVRSGAERRGGDLRRYQAGATVALVALVMLAVFSPTVEAARRVYKQAQPDTRTLAAGWLDANAPTASKVWLEEPPLQLPPDRYLMGAGPHVTEHPLSWYVAARYDYLVLTDQAYKDVFDHPDHNPDLHNAYARFFEQNKGLLAVEFASKQQNSGPEIRIYRTGYSPPTSPADVHPTVPLSAVFTEAGTDGRRVGLLGADLPPTATIGSSLPLVLYWQAQKPVHSDYTVFVHLLNAAGARVAQRDTGPRSNTDPTSGWRAGGIVVDEADLALPDGLPPGDYMLRVGLYLQSSGINLPVSGAPGGCPDCVLLGPVKLVR